MNIRESMIKSFKPDVFVRVGDINNGGVPQAILREVQQPLGEKYDTMMDTESGVIYLKTKREKGGGKK